MKGSLRYKDGAWRLTVMAGRRADGRTHRVHRTVRAADNRTGRREAERALATLVAEVNAGKHAAGPDLTVAEALDQWLGHHRRDLEVRTAMSYRSHIDSHLGPHLGQLRLKKLTPADIDRCYRQLHEQGLSAKTIRNAHTTLHAALTQAVRWGWIQTNPAARADPPTAKRPPVNVPTPDQVTAAVAASTPAFAVLVRLAATTGHRQGTLAALRWTDIDLDAGEIVFARAIVDAGAGRLIEKGTKADRIDRATLGAATVDALRSHRARCVEAALSCGVPLRADAFVWSPNPGGGRPRRPSSISSEWRATCARASVDGVRFHDLRHFAITQMLTAGIPAHVVGQRVGISVPTMFKVYAHFLPRADVEAAELMDRLLG